MGKIVAFDVETTGLDPYTDRIVEIAMRQTGLITFSAKVNPTIPICAEATEVHGITNEEAQTYEPFSAYASIAQDMVDGATLLTYNGRRFDTVMLDQELRRAGYPGIDLDTVVEIDLLRVWSELEPRTLTGAVARFMGEDLEDAHSASADTEVLPQLMHLIGQMFDVGLDQMTSISRPGNEVDRSGKLYRDEDDVVRFNFGAKRDEPVRAHMEARGYVWWMLNKGDFPQDALQALRDDYKELSGSA